MRQVNEVCHPFLTGAASPCIGAQRIDIQMIWFHLLVSSILHKLLSKRDFTPISSDSPILYTLQRYTYIATQITQIENHFFFSSHFYSMGTVSSTSFATANVENCYDNLIGSIQFNAALFFHRLIRLQPSTERGISFLTMMVLLLIETVLSVGFFPFALSIFISQFCMRAQDVLFYVMCVRDRRPHGNS